MYLPWNSIHPESTLGILPPIKAVGSLYSLYNLERQNSINEDVMAPEQRAVQWQIQICTRATCIVDTIIKPPSALEIDRNLCLVPSM
jgi:hypothetical protein